MFQNYLTSAVRNFFQHKLYSFINVAGLTVGFVCVILIGLYVREELSFDTWLPDSANIYRISLQTHVPGQPMHDSGGASAPLGPTLIAEIPGVLEQTRIHTKGVTTLSFGDRRFSEIIHTVDANFFTMIKLPFAAGDPSKALTRPDGIVLTQRAAIRFFGTDRAIGRILILNGNLPRTVTGILRDLPYNTQFQGEVFAPYPPTQFNDQSGAAADSASNLWTTMDVSSYVKLSPDVPPSAIERQIPSVIMRHLSPSFISKVVSVVHGAAKNLLSAKLVPMTEVHLTKYAHGSGLKPTGSRVQVYGFAAIAILLLMIAGFNFTNLATARATLRIREVALRKVCGASRRQLIAQFLSEAVLTALLALFIAFAASEVLLPAYGKFIGHPMAISYISNWPLVLAMIGIAIVTGLISGFYPALILSGHRPAEALHSANATPRNTGLLRNVLVLFQFAISIGLGVVVIGIFSQIRFAQSLDLGFDRDNIVVLNIDGTNISTTAAAGMTKALEALPGVSAAAMSNMVPASINAPMNIVRLPHLGKQVSILTYSISPDFADVYGIELKTGRFLSRKYGTDQHHGLGLEESRNVLIDENAARAFGFLPDQAIGKKIDMIGVHTTIVGVVHNILFSGAQAIQTEPTVYYDNPDISRYVSVRMKAGMIPETVAGIDRVWQRFIPASPVVRWFVDDSMNNLYADAERQGQLMCLFVALAIFIACMGLFGLAAFTVERRTKEIGIRKVFGATTQAIVRLLLRQFSIPVLIANFFAWPAAWFYLNSWLENFSYKIQLSPYIFLAAGLTALLIAWVTVIIHTISVARANPMQALKYE